MATNFENLKKNPGRYSSDVETFISLKDMLSSISRDMDLVKDMERIIQNYNNTWDGRAVIQGIRVSITKVTDYLREHHTSLLQGDDMIKNLSVYTAFLRIQKRQINNDPALTSSIEALLTQLIYIENYIKTFNNDTKKYAQFVDFYTSKSAPKKSLVEEWKSIIKNWKERWHHFISKISWGAISMPELPPTSDGTKSISLEDIKTSFSTLLDPNTNSQAKIELMQKQTRELSLFYTKFKTEFEAHVTNARNAQGALKAKVEKDSNGRSIHNITLESLADVQNNWSDARKFEWLADFMTDDYYGETSEKLNKLIQARSVEEIGMVWRDTTFWLSLWGFELKVPWLWSRPAWSKMTKDEWYRLFREMNTGTDAKAKELAENMSQFTGQIDDIVNPLKEELSKVTASKVESGTSLSYEWGWEVFVFETYKEKALFLSFMLVMLEWAFNDFNSGLLVALKSWVSIASIPSFLTPHLFKSLWLSWGWYDIVSSWISSLLFWSPIAYKAYSLSKTVSNIPLEVKMNWLPWDFLKNLLNLNEMKILQDSIKTKKREQWKVIWWDHWSPWVVDTSEGTRFSRPEQNLMAHEEMIQILENLVTAEKGIQEAAWNATRVEELKKILEKLDKFKWTKYMVYYDGLFMFELERLISSDAWFSSRGSFFYNLYKRNFRVTLDLIKAHLSWRQKASIYERITGRKWSAKDFDALVNQDKLWVLKIKDAWTKAMFMQDAISVASDKEEEFKKRVKLFTTFESDLEANNTQDPSFSDVKEKLLAIARGKIKNTAEFEKLFKPQDGKSIIVLTREILSEAKNVWGFKDDIIKVLLEKLSTPENPTFEIIPPITELHREVVWEEKEWRLANLITKIESLNEYQIWSESLAEKLKKIVREGLVNQNDDRISDLRFIFWKDRSENFRSLCGIQDTTLREKLLSTLIEQIEDHLSTEEAIKKTLEIPWVYSNFKKKLESITDKEIKDKILKEVEKKWLSAWNMEPYTKDGWYIDSYLKIQKEILANIELDAENKTKIETTLKEAFEKDVIDWIKIERIYNEGTQLIKIAERRHTELREDARAKAQTEQMLAANGKSLPGEKPVWSNNAITPQNEWWSSIEIQTPAIKKIKNDIKLALAYQMAFDDTPESTRNNVNSFLESSEAQTMSLAQYEQKLKTLLQVQNLPANPKELELRAVKVDGVIIWKYIWLETSNAAIKRAVETLVEDYKEAKNNGREKLEEFLRKEEARIKFKDVAKKI